MAVATGEGNPGCHFPAAQLADGLRQVAQRASGLTESKRRLALELYLAYRLEREEPQRMQALLRETLERFDPGGGVARGRKAGGPVAGAAVMEEPSSTDGVEGSLEELVGMIRSLAGPDADPTLSPEALLAQLKDRAEAVDRSVKQTAKEFFDRLMKALDPETARAFVGKPGLRPAPLYKAAVFDAYAEKFSQLAEYHQKGRLVRDFRASFKRNLQA